MPDPHAAAPPELTLDADFLAHLDGLRLRARKRLLGSRKGGHPSPRRGSSLEFADHRLYVPGDELRYVDWGLYGRTDRLYVKLFHEEEDLHGYLFVDASASMALPRGASKYATAAHLALALAYVILAANDPVKVHVFGDDDAVSPFLRGRRHVRTIRRLLASRQPRGRLELTAALVPHLRRLRHPGKAIVVSDFLFDAEDCRRGLGLLTAANLDVAVLQVLAPDDLEPPLAPQGLVVADSESGVERVLAFGPRERAGYVAALERHNHTLRSFCHHAGIHYALFDTGNALQDFVLRELPALGLLA